MQLKLHWSTRTNSTVWLLRYACAQPYHPHSGSHGQLFRPCWGLSQWHSRRFNERGNPCIKDPSLPRLSSAKHPFKRQLHRTPRCWFSPLLREIFLPVFRFPPSSKTNIFKFQFNQESGRRRIVICLLVMTKGDGVRATTIEGQNAFAPTRCFA